MLLFLRVLIAKIDRKVLPYFSFPAARIFASIPKLKTTRLNYYRKTEAPNADLYKLHQVKMLQNMLGTTTTNKKTGMHIFQGAVFTWQVRDSCVVICMKSRRTER